MRYYEQSETNAEFVYKSTDCGIVKQKRNAEAEFNFQMGDYSQK